MVTSVRYLRKQAPVLVIASKQIAAEKHFGFGIIGHKRTGGMAVWRADKPQRSPAFKPVRKPKLFNAQFGVLGRVIIDKDVVFVMGNYLKVRIIDQRFQMRNAAA